MPAQDDEHLDQYPRDSRAAFAARGEAAWQKYLRDGVSTPAEAVFARIDALIAERAVQLRAETEN